MLVFLIATIMFLATGNGILKIFFDMIQPGNALDIVFGWQKMLANLYRSENKFKQLLEKALGGCEKCTAFWFMPLWFFCYYFFMKNVAGVWVTDFITIKGFWYWFSVCLVNWVWYCNFHTIGANGGHILLTLLKKKKDAV